MSLLLLTLKEDSWKQDLCTRFCVERFGLNPKQQLSFQVIARGDGCFSGQAVVDELGVLEGISFKIRHALKEGESFKKNDVLLEAEGPLSLVLSVERSLLNLLQHSCAIATLTQKIHSKIKTRAAELNIPIPELLHTRKTLPGLKDFQITAVLSGGGKLHRRDLSSGYLFKENHKYLCKEMGIGFERFVKSLVDNLGGAKFQIEVENEEEFHLVRSLGAKKILLDNFKPKQISDLLKNIDPSLEIEISGGLNPENIESYVLPGVHRLSLGFLTHSVAAFDLGLDWKFLK